MHNYVYEYIVYNNTIPSQIHYDQNIIIIVSLGSIVILRGGVYI